MGLLAPREKLLLGGTMRKQVGKIRRWSNLIFFQ
jgi:hypothetical protein